MLESLGQESPCLQAGEDVNALRAKPATVLPELAQNVWQAASEASISTCIAHPCRDRINSQQCPV